MSLLVTGYGQCYSYSLSLSLSLSYRPISCLPMAIWFCVDHMEKAFS